MSIKSILAVSITTLVFGVGSIQVFASPGSGQSKKKFDLKGFERIEIKTAADVSIKIGPAYSVVVEGDRARVDNVTAEITKNTLVIEETQSDGEKSNGKIKVTVTLPKLSAIGFSGAGSAVVEGVKSDSFSAAINGSCTMTLKGSAKKVDYAIHGAGSINAKSLASHSCAVAISGSGTVSTKTASKLDAVISGSGAVTYYGDPKISRVVSGSGKIMKASD